MSSEFVTWLGHPATFGLVALICLSVHLVGEILLRSLAEMGNVRFQGMLHDHPKLFPEASTITLHLSSLLNVLRWIHVLVLAIFWLTISHIPGWNWREIAPTSIIVPILSIAVARRLANGLGEDSIATLISAMRPFIKPMISVVLMAGASQPIPPPEDEEEEASEREIQAFLDVGQAAGIIEGDEGEILESLVEFFDTTVKEVMTPRTEMVAVEQHSDFDKLFERLVSTHKSRIPVYEKTIDNVVGVIHVKNLVKGLRSGEHPPISDLMHNCLVVPESKKLGEILRDFQKEHQQLAIVVDEYGGTSGLVTLEDILEEIVGEIQDEHDPQPLPESQEISPGLYRMRGRAPLETLEEIFDIDLEEEEMETVGGLVFDRHGTVPSTGTEVEDPENGLRFTVEEMRDRRIAAVTVQRTEVKDED